MGNASDVNKDTFKYAYPDSVPGVQESEQESKTSDRSAEVPTIVLSPDQIEEIHADEYSLVLFYATRMEPLSINEIKRRFAEPEPKKAVAVMERFVRVGLVTLNSSGKYYSNYPENYINYASYRYDSDLESRKDSRVFQLMKDFCGNREYWKNKSYFSIDSFFSDEQSEEIQEMFYQIKLKAKAYANENAKKRKLDGLKFRRLKFYDMIFSLLLIVGSVFVSSAFAEAGGGNEPIVHRASESFGGGNDPTRTAVDCTSEVHLYQAGVFGNVIETKAYGGGGHDPGGNQPASQLVPACELEELLIRARQCLGSDEIDCREVRIRLKQLGVGNDEEEI